MGRMPSIGSGCVLIIRLRTRLAARGIRNRAVTRNIVRRILIAAPARCAHLMPEEGADGDDECGAHEKRRRQYRQILTRRTHPLQPAAIFARFGGGRGQAPPARVQGPAAVGPSCHRADSMPAPRPRACTRNGGLEPPAGGALRKGVPVVGRGDFTHPEWADELTESLVPAEPGLFRLSNDAEVRLRRSSPRSCGGEVRFMLSAEISTI